MRRFVTRQNIVHFKRMLNGETDDSARPKIETLLSEAQLELEFQERIWSRTCPHLAIPDSLGRAAERLLAQAVEAHRAEFGSLQVWDWGTQTLRLVAHVGFDRESVEQFAAVRNGQGSVCEAAHLTNSRVAVEDVDTSEEFVSLRQWTRRIGIRAIQTTPVRDATGRCIGAFSTHFARPHVFTAGEHAAGDDFGARIGELLANLPNL